MNLPKHIATKVWDVYNRLCFNFLHVEFLNYDAIMSPRLFIFVSAILQTPIKKLASTSRKYHNHTLQTNPRRCDEELQNNNSNKTPGALCAAV